MPNDYKQSFARNRKRYIPYKRRKNEKLLGNTQCPKSEAVTNVTPIPLETYNSKVKLFQSRCQIREINRTMAKISKYHILESKNTGLDIWHKITNTDIGLIKRTDYGNTNLHGVIRALSPILELFKNRHNRFNYLEKLKCMIAENSKKYPAQKFKHQIHVRLLQSFFSLLVYENVSFKLFGTYRNLKAIKKTICHLLETVPGEILITRSFKGTTERVKAIGASLDMGPLFKKLDISKINWLHSIDNDTVKWIIILKLLHWFFTQYIIKILHKYVVLKAIGKQWVYITKDDWCNMQEEYIKKKLNDSSLVPFTRLYMTFKFGRYKFIPSSSGVRALFLAKYDIDEKYDRLDVILRFLQQLYVTYINKNGISTIVGCKMAITNFINSRSKNQLYFVRCDIQDAFDSIIQKKLHDIVLTYCEQIPSYVEVQVCTLLKPKRKQNKILRYTVKIISNCLNELVSKNIIPTTEKPQLLKKKWFTEMLPKLIHQPKVKLNDRIYLVERGVPQGLSTSPILSEIYYQYMMKEMFFEYTNNGLLSTYVDDILYITDKEHYAVKFLEIIRNGIPEYNVTFDPRKIQSNVGMPHTSTKIKFLGRTYTINRGAYEESKSSVSSTSTSTSKCNTPDACTVGDVTAFCKLCGTETLGLSELHSHLQLEQHAENEKLLHRRLH